MERRAELRSRIVGIADLRQIVGAMRSLAAIRLRQAEETLGGLRHYQEVIGRAIASGLLLSAEPPLAASSPTARRTLVLFTSERGFVGPFNERLIDRMAVEVDPSTELAIIGSRGARVASKREMAVAWSLPMATHPGGVGETARHVAAELDRRLDEGTTVAVDLVSARFAAEGMLSIARQALLPIDMSVFRPGQGASPPLHNLPAPVLLEKLAAEYVMAELMRAAMESLAAENATRVQAMEAAHDHIDRRLGELNEEERRLRQEEVTTELLDIIVGAGALAGRA